MVTTVTGMLFVYAVYSLKSASLYGIVLVVPADNRAAHLTEFGGSAGNWIPFSSMLHVQRMRPGSLCIVLYIAFVGLGILNNDHYRTSLRVGKSRRILLLFVLHYGRQCWHDDWTSHDAEPYTHDHSQDGPGTVPLVE